MLDVWTDQIFLRVEFENAKIETSATRYDSFRIPARALSVSNSFEARAQRDLGVFHVIADFTPIEGRKRGVRKTKPCATKPIPQCCYVLVQNVGHRAPVASGHPTKRAGGLYAAGYPCDCGRPRDLIPPH